MATLRNNEIDIFVVLGYEILRDDGAGKQYPYLHTVWSGFNQAFRKVFEGIDPVLYVQELHETGLVELHPYKGGARMKIKPEMLHTLSTEEQALSARLRTFLTNFRTAYLAEKERRIKAKELKNVAVPTAPSKAKPSATMKKAADLWNRGDTAAALDRLKY